MYDRPPGLSPADHSRSSVKRSNSPPQYFSNASKKKNNFPPELLQSGSDFSSAGLSRLIHRNQRPNEARHCAKTKWGATCPAFMSGQASGSGVPAAA
jgi:hypothetical protein